MIRADSCSEKIQRLMNWSLRLVPLSGMVLPMASMDDMSAVDNMSMPMFIMNTMSVTMTMVH